MFEPQRTWPLQLLPIGSSWTGDGLVSCYLTGCIVTTVTEMGGTKTIKQCGAATIAAFVFNEFLTMF